MAKTTKKTTTKKKTTKKLLPSATEHSTTIELADTAAALVIDSNNSAKVYVSAKTDESAEVETYAPNEELVIALAALLQNPNFVDTTIKTFRELFEAAIAKQNLPMNGIDDE